MKIHVTQKHIDEGTCKIQSQCAIAQSLKEVTGLFACVGPLTITLFKWRGGFERVWTGDTPKRASSFIHSYDGPDGKLCAKPFSFNLPIDHLVQPKASLAIAATLAQP